MKKTIIIGSGIAGLASAIRRRLKGDEVVVLEQASYPGGKLHEFTLGQYRFDGGPSLFTQPQYIQELFDEAGVDMTSYFEYARMPESCRYFWEDGIKITAFSDINEFDKEVSQTLHIPPGTVLSYLRNSEWKQKTVGHIFLERSLHRLKSWMKADVFKALLHTPSFGLFQSLHEWNKKRLKHEKLVQLFDRYATYNGSDPYRTSAMMSVIPHFEHNEGTFLPKGGMYRIPTALYKLGLDLGITYRFNHKVDEILIKEKSVVGVKVNEKEIYGDQVICNMDVMPTYEKLLPDIPTPKKILKQERSSSAIIFYWGIRKSFQELGLHNILFSEDYRSEFRAIKGGKMIEDPTVYINITSKYELQDAPEEGENWFVMINAPFDNGQNWDEMVAECRRNTIKKVNSILNTDISSYIEEEKVWSPPGIASQTSSYQGALYGSSSNDLMSAFNRHPNFHSSLKNLFFCGGSVHPGGGIPLCLLSAKITDQEISSN